MNNQFGGASLLEKVFGLLAKMSFIVGLGAASQRKPKTALARASLHRPENAKIVKRRFQ